MTEKPNSYDVGHGKPPRDSQFKSGKSGNPKGRPKGSKNFRTLLLEIANQEVPSKHGTITRAEMLVRDLVDAAAEGKAKPVLSVAGLMQRLDTTDEPEGLDGKTFARMFAAAKKQMHIETEKALNAARVKWAAEAKAREEEAKAAAAKQKEAAETAAKEKEAAETAVKSKAEEK